MMRTLLTCRKWIWIPVLCAALISTLSLIRCNEADSCAAQGGTICPPEESCARDWLEAGNTERCCPEACAAVPDSGVDAEADVLGDAASDAADAADAAVADVADTGE